MLQLGSKTFTVDGVTVFADHADPDQFWVLPAQVRLARRDADNRPQFTFIKYAREAVDGGVQGGGFLSFEADLRLDPELEARIRSQAATLAQGTPRIALVPFDEGAVETVALDLQGPGGTNAEPPGPAAVVVVETILGASVPSLRGDNAAAFSLTLSREGAEILEETFRGGGQPIGVIYDLKFTGLRPALKVEISADFQRIHNHFSTSLDVGAGFPVNGVPVFIRADIDAAFEKLRQDGVIDIEVIDFSDAADRQSKENWALEFFKNQLLADWFKPTLQPIRFDEDSGGPLGGLGELIGKATGGGSESGGSSSETGGGSGGGSSGNGSESGDSSSQGGGTTSSAADDNARSEDGDSEGSGTGRRQAARLDLKDTSPSPPPQGYGIRHTPADSGTRESLNFAGGEQAPSVQVDGEPQTLSGRSLTVQVAPGQTRRIQAQYPAPSQAAPRFHLFFDFDKPDDEGWNSPPRNRFNAYLNDNAEVHRDRRFAMSDGSENPPDPPDPQARHGAAALRHWIREQPAPDKVSIIARASFEDIPAKDRHNQELSERRLEVAAAIVNPHARIIRRSAQGDDPHQAVKDDPTNTKPPEAFRVAIVEGPEPEPETQESVTLIAELSRPEAPSGGGADDGGETDTDDGSGDGSSDGGGGNGGGGNGGGGDGGDGGGGGDGGDGGGGGGGGDGGGGGGGGNGGDGSSDGDGGNGDGGDGGEGTTGVSIAFKLRAVRQEELKSVTLRYNRAEAVQQRYAPQGFFGLLAEDLDREGHFFDVRLDDPFFQEFTVSAEVPVDFAAIGLDAVHLALDYGDPSDANNHTHEEFSFTPDQRGPKAFRVLMNEDFDTAYTQRVQFHFDAQSDWEGERITYELPPERSEDRTLQVNPFRHLGFLAIEVTPGEIDPGIVERIDVHLSYEDPDGWETTRTLRVTPEASPQFWRLRLSNREARRYSYRLVHHLKDGSTRETDTQTRQAAGLTVDDPFVDALELSFETLLLNPERVRMVFVDVEYDDPDNDYRRRESLRIPGDATGPRTLRIALLNPERREYRYRVTFVSTDDEVRREPFVTTDETRILLGED